MAIGITLIHKETFSTNGDKTVGSLSLSSNSSKVLVVYLAGATTNRGYFSNVKYGNEYMRAIPSNQLSGSHHIINDVYELYNPTTGNNLTFTYSGTVGAADISIMICEITNVASDEYTNVTKIMSNSGTATTTVNNCLVVDYRAWYTDSTIDTPVAASGWTKLDTLDNNIATLSGVGIGYKTVATAGSFAITPSITWSNMSTTITAGTVIAYKEGTNTEGSTTNILSAVLT